MKDREGQDNDEQQHMWRVTVTQIKACAHCNCFLEVLQQPFAPTTPKQIQYYSSLTLRRSRPHFQMQYTSRKIRHQLPYLI